MSIKRILFPVHDRDDMRPVADWAFDLARRFGAGITGIFPQVDAASAIAVGGEPSAAFAPV